MNNKIRENANDRNSLLPDAPLSSGACCKTAVNVTGACKVGGPEVSGSPGAEY